MRNLIILILLGFQFTAYAQGIKSGKTTISISFLAPMEDTVVIHVQSRENNNLPVVTHYKKPVNGKVLAELDISTISTLDISFGKDMLSRNYFDSKQQGLIWISPGDGIALVVPNRESTLYDDIMVSGKGSDKINFFKDYYEVMERNMKPFRQPNVAALKDTFDENQFFYDMILRTDSLQSKYRDKIPSRFFELFRDSQIMYAHYQFSFSQPLDDKAKSNFRKFESLYPLENFTKGGIPSLPLGIEDFLVNRALVAYNIQKGNETYMKMKRNYSQVPSIIAAYYKNKSLATKITAKYFSNSIHLYGNIDSLGSQVNLFVNKSDKSNPDIKQLEELLHSVNTNQKTGAKAYSFELKDEYNKVVKMTDFKGKVILLDFMFNGCGGCKMMVPGMEQVETHFQGKKVVFISVSIDRTFEKFKDAIGVYNTKHSVHLYTNGRGGAHEMIKHYNISGYPTIVLIDKNGNLISARAPRADSHQKELIGIIEKALEK